MPCQEKDDVDASTRKPLVAGAETELFGGDQLIVRTEAVLIQSASGPAGSQSKTRSTRFDRGTDSSAG